MQGFKVNLPLNRATASQRKWAQGFSIAICVAVLLTTCAAQTSSPRDALWQIVSGMCVPDQTQHHDPKPCTAVDLQEGGDHGYAVLKDIRGETQFLLIPTARIPGMESPAVLAPDAANYLASAWEARSYVEGALHRNLPP